ncbi:MAG: matrixin family metalloprotease [Methanosarcinales archaeon]|jgi:hypothetical protein|nr:matrixin family metalloprotease [Methanosarcinales archaeon]
MKSKLILCLFVICLLLLFSGFASAYNLYDDNGKKYKWHRSYNNPVWVNASSYNSSWQSVVNNSINNITSSGANFGFINQNGRIEVMMAAHALYAAGNETGDPLGRTTYSSYTYYPSNQTFVLTASKIAINTNKPWHTSGNSTKSYNLPCTISHELCHVAGLHHHNGTNSVMRPLLTMGEYRPFGSDDINGLTAIYGRY